MQRFFFSSKIVVKNPIVCLNGDLLNTFKSIYPTLIQPYVDIEIIEHDLSVKKREQNFESALKDLLQHKVGVKSMTLQDKLEDRIVYDISPILSYRLNCQIYSETYKNKYLNGSKKIVQSLYNGNNKDIFLPKGVHFATNTIDQSKHDLYDLDRGHIFKYCGQSIQQYCDRAFEYCVENKLDLCLFLGNQQVSPCDEKMKLIFHEAATRKYSKFLEEKNIKFIQYDVQQIDEFMKTQRQLGSLFLGVSYRQNISEFFENKIYTNKYYSQGCIINESTENEFSNVIAWINALCMDNLLKEQRAKLDDNQELKSFVSEFRVKIESQFASKEVPKYLHNHFKNKENLKEIDESEFLKQLGKIKTRKSV